MSKTHQFVGVVAWLLVGCMGFSGCNNASNSTSSTKDAKKVAANSAADQTGASKAATTSSADSSEKSADDSANDAADGGKKVAKPMPRPKGRRVAVVKAPAAAGQVDPAELIMPKVMLSETESATCLVNVGDAMPDVELPDLDGQPQALSKLRGEKLTVVAFWTAGHPYAVEELADLGPAVSDQFDDQGVAVVGINEKNSPAEVQQVVDRVGASFPILIDKDGVAWSKVAAKKLPRTYLLDADGKILWFDMEYSRSTRRDLLRAIRFQLSQK